MKVSDIEYIRRLQDDMRSARAEVIRLAEGNVIHFGGAEDFAPGTEPIALTPAASDEARAAYTTYDTATVAVINALRKVSK